MVETDYEYRLACLEDEIDKLQFCLDKVVKVLIDFREQQNFILEQVLKTRCEVTGTTNKTPYKRLEELENSFKGFLAFYHEEGMKRHPKRKDDAF